MFETGILTKTGQKDSSLRAYLKQSKENISGIKHEKAVAEDDRGAK